MRWTRCLCVAVVIGGLVGCVSVEKRAAKVEVQIQEERLQFIKKYRECLNKHSGKTGGDQCDRYLKALQSVF